MGFVSSFRGWRFDLLGRLTSPERKRRATQLSRQEAIITAARAAAEPLEVRTMLSTEIGLYADAGANSFYIRQSGGDVQIFQNQPLSGAPFASAPVSDQDPIDIWDVLSNTTVTVDYSGGDPIAGGLGIQYDSSSATGNQLVLKNTNNATISLAPNETQITGSGYDDTISYSNYSDERPEVSLQNATGSTLLNVSAETTSGIVPTTFTFNTDLGATNGTVDMEVFNGATVDFGTAEHLDSLTIDSGAAVAMLPAGGEALDTNSVAVSGTLDLSDNDLIVNDPSSSGMTTLQEDVVAGYNYSQGISTALSQGSIFSSTAADDGMSIGVAPAADISLSTLDGQTIPSTALVARYTYSGDANLDGVVNAADLSEVLVHYGASLGVTPPKWYEGDFNYDGIVNGSDLQPILVNFGAALAQPTDVTQGTAYTVSLPGDTPDDSTIARWDLDWGDGEVDSYPAGVTTASHVYTQTGPFLLQMSALTDSGAVHEAPAQSIAVTATSGVTPYTLFANPGDTIDISADGNGNTIITDDDSVVETIPTADLLTLGITGDTYGTLTVDFSNGDPLPPSGLSTDSAQVDITGSSGSDTLFTTTTAAIFGNAEIRYPSTTALTFLNAGSGDQIAAVAGTVTIDGDTSNNGQGSANGGPTVIVNTSATVLFTGTQHLSALDILNGGTARMAESGQSVLVTAQLNIAPATSTQSGGLLDLADNDMIVTEGSLSTIDNWLGNGYDNSWWDDEDMINGYIAPAAIDSSTAVDDPSSSEGLGSAEVGLGQGQLNLTTFDDQTVTTNDILVKFTYYGDLNLTGSVTAADLQTVENNMGSGLTGWTNGDMNYDGVINSADKQLVHRVEIESNDGFMPPGSITLAADGDFPMSSLPLVALSGGDISSWEINWGIGDTQDFSPSDTLALPYPDVTGTNAYMATLIPLDPNGDPEYCYPHVRINVAYVTLPVPSDLTATETDGSVTLNWTGDSMFGTSFNVYASTDGGASFTQFDSTGSNTDSDELTGLNPGTDYVFQVTAVNGTTETAPSNTVALTSPALPEVPGDLTAMLDAGNVVLNWTGDDSLAAGYNIYMSTDGGQTFNYFDSAGPGVTTYTTNGMADGATYQFEVTAENSSGETAASAAVAQAVPQTPSVTVDLSADCTSATLSWTPDPTVVGYVIDRTPDDGSSGPVQVGSTSGATNGSYMDSGLDPMQGYTYTMTPYTTANPPSPGDSTGEGAGGTADTYTGNVENFSATSPPGSALANLTWSYQGSDSFEIEEEDTGAAGTNFYWIASTSARSYQVTDLQVGDTYDFRIRADHADGTVSDYVGTSVTPGGSAESISATVQTTYVSVYGDDGNLFQSPWYSLQLNWTAPVNAQNQAPSGYTVQYWSTIGVGTGWIPFNTYGSGVTSASNISIGGGESGQFRIQASYPDGTVSAWAQSGTVTQPAEPVGVPVICIGQVTASAVTVSDTEIDVTFSANPSDPPSGEVTYYVYYAPYTAPNEPGSPWINDPTVSHVTLPAGQAGTVAVTGLAPGTKYDFRVLANWWMNDYYRSDLSPIEPVSSDSHATATTTGTNATQPAAPAWVKAVIDPSNAGQADVSWQNTPNNESGFTLQESVDGGATWTTVDNPAADKTSDTVDISQLNPGTVQFQVASTAPASQPTKSNVVSIPLIILVSGFQQTNHNGAAPSVAVGAGVTQIRADLVGNGGPFTAKEVPPPFNSESYGAALGSEKAIATYIAQAGQNAHGQPVQVAMVGYSMGGGAVYDVETNMAKGTNGFPQLPGNVTFAETIYVDAIIDGIGRQIVMALFGGVLIDPVTNAAPNAGALLDYYQSSKVNEPADDYDDKPHGAAVGNNAVDLDLKGSLNAQVAQFDGNIPGNLQLPFANDSFSHTGAAIGTHSIDKDPTLHKIIEDDLRSLFGRPIIKI